MSIRMSKGKDLVIFATKEDHATPSTVKLPESQPSPGLILPDGSINWNCPCLGGMSTGPCGVEFREAFSCFHYSEAEPKGSDCYDAFKNMHNCMAQYPSLYQKDEKGLDLEQSTPSKTSIEQTKISEEINTKPEQSKEVKTS